MNTCTFEGCYREIYCKGLCPSHYAQAKRGQTLAPLRRKRKIINGQKECSRCGQVKKVPEEYHVLRATGKPVTGWCKACTNSVSAQRRLEAKNKREADQESTHLKGGVTA